MQCTQAGRSDYRRRRTARRRLLLLLLVLMVVVVLVLMTDEERAVRSRREWTATAAPTVGRQQ